MKENISFCRINVTGDDKMKEKMVDRLHLIYLSILFGISIVFVITLYYGGGIRAGEMLSFAATLSSILLALIAIVITIVDVAGQRNTVADLKDIAKKLEDNLETANESVQEVSAVKEELLSAMNDIMKINSSLVKEIASLKIKYSKVNDTSTESGANINIIEDLNKLSEKVQKIHVAPTYRYDYFRITQSNKDKEITNMVKNVFEESYIPEEALSLSDIIKILHANGLHLSRSKVKHELTKLVNKDVIKRTDDGKYFR
ncbi:hypothetical protein ACWE42_16185 [Sutcliffiella cohnii]